MFPTGGVEIYRIARVRPPFVGPRPYVYPHCLSRIASIMASSTRPFFEWLRSLATNVYVWGGLAALFLLGLLVYVLVDAVVMPSYTRHGVAVEMPNVERQPFDEAKQVLKRQNLRVQRQSGRFNPNVPQDIVVDQTPPPSASVKPGRRAYLTVNAGEARMVTLPDLSGTSLREARNRLTTLGLAVDTVQADSIPSPYPNTVTRQRPAPGDSLREGKGVALWYSRGLGQERVRVPDIRGLPMSTAQSTLLRQKLRWVVVDTSTVTVQSQDQPDTASADTAAQQSLFVRSQGRAPGMSVRAGTEIRLYPTSDSLRARSLRERRPDSVRVDSVQQDSSIRRDTSRIGF